MRKNLKPLKDLEEATNDILEHVNQEPPEEEPEEQEAGATEPEPEEEQEQEAGATEPVQEDEGASYEGLEEGDTITLSDIIDEKEAVEFFDIAASRVFGFLGGGLYNDEITYQDFKLEADEKRTLSKIAKKIIRKIEINLQAHHIFLIACFFIYGAKLIEQRYNGGRWTRKKEDRKSLKAVKSEPKKEKEPNNQEKGKILKKIENFGAKINRQQRTIKLLKEDTPEHIERLIEQAKNWGYKLI